MVEEKTYVAERLQMMVPVSEGLYKDILANSALAASIEQNAQRYLSELADEKWPGRVARMEYDPMEYRKASFPSVTDENGNDVRVPAYGGIMYATAWVVPE